MIYKIQNETLCALVCDTGAELISVTKDGREYIWQADKTYWGSHAPLLFPVCGRLLNGRYLSEGKEYEMGAHGFAKKLLFKLIEQDNSSIVLSLSSCEETKKAYPFDFEIKVKFSISGDTLSVGFDVMNSGNTVMPYMIGWHPGFMLEDDGEIGEYYLDFCGKKGLMWYPLQNGCFVRPYGEDYPTNEGKYYLSEDEIYSNDTMIFTGADSVTLCHPSGRPIIKMNYSDNLPYLCLWKAPHAEARYICLEPWSDVPSDGETRENFDSRKMSRLASGRNEVYKYEVKFI